MRIGLDIGGTKVAAALLDDSGHVLTRTWHDHAARGLENVAAELAATADRLEGRSENSPIGVSVSGLVRHDGFVTGGASLELVGDLAGAISGRLPGHPVRVFNDAEATLRSVLTAYEAEHGERVRDAVLLTIGTGIGGAIVAGGRPVRGQSGLATELGHLPVMPPSEDLCVCGSSGCFEQYAGGKGIAALADKAVLEGRASDALRRAAAGGTLTTKDVVTAARAGDTTARDLLEQAAVCCAQAIRALCVTVEPRVVFLGGSIAHGAADLLSSRIEHHLRRWWPFAALTDPPSVRLDSIGPYAAALGAAMLTQDLPISPQGGQPTGTTLEDTDND